MNSKYGEIMGLPHRVSKTRPRVPTTAGTTAKERNAQISKQSGGNT